MRRILVCLGIALAATPAFAANGLRPRTPAVFGEVACMQTVAQGDVVDIPYSVPFDDTELTPDELTDSRQHQFFAFGRQRFDFTPPTWINQSDYDRAEANGDITKIFGDDDILEKSSLWPAGSWVPITADDARVPITMAQAAMGVQWDTTDVPPGTWLVYGYTWEPENNLWSLRQGAIRLEAPGDPDSAGPSLFIEPLSSPLATRGEPLAIPGCVVASQGTTMTAYWGTAEGVDEPEWVPFAEDVPVQTGALDLDFDAPAETGDTVRIRVDLTDAAGRTYTAYLVTLLGVVGEAPAADDDGGGGCRCGGTAPSPAWLGLASVGLLGLRRRRKR